MRYRGGYNVMLAGKPDANTRKLPEPEVLHVPLYSSRFSFSELRVEDGTEIKRAQVIAVDPANYNVPLLAPMGGTVSVDEDALTITISNISPDASESGATGEGTSKLLQLGAWQFFCDARNGRLPDPDQKPSAIIVTTAHFDPFVVRGDVQLEADAESFERGLQALKALAPDASIHVAVPALNSPLVSTVKTAAGKVDAKVVAIPLRYPFGNTELLARLHGLDTSGPVWGLGVEGVIAVDGAMNAGEPALHRIISVGGPAVDGPTHAVAMVGYPLEAVAKEFGVADPVRTVCGGALSAEAAEPGQQGLDTECLGITFVPENTEREILAWTHVGLWKHAFTNCFAGKFLPAFREKYNTAIRAEKRACVSCGACEQACPAGIAPHLLLKYLDKGRIADAAAYGMERCVLCGLCTHVCLSKLEHMASFVEAKKKLAEVCDDDGGQA